MTTIYISNETMLSVVDKSESFLSNIIIGNIEERICFSYGKVFQCSGMLASPLNCKSDAAAEWLVAEIARAIWLDKEFVGLKPFQG